jgi:3-phosphoshikimate 1-carboxyvinyltransferase
VTEPLSGSVRVPGDKSISHRSLMIGALCNGTVEVSGLGTGHDNLATGAILRQMGVAMEREGTSARVHGVGLHGLQRPDGPLDCGNSGTTMRLMLGVLAGQPWEATLVGDASLSQRPMARVLTPLAQMGLEVLETADGERAPLRIHGRRPLEAITYASPIASAQVKSAVLLAGLYAEGETRVVEPGLSRDHTERMLAYLGRGLEAKPLSVPGDLSSAAFLVGAALLHPGSVIRIEAVGVNPTRTGFLDVLGAMGAAVSLENAGEANGEPYADLVVGPGALQATNVGGELALRSLDELPLIATLASRAEGVTRISDAAELRVKESDRIARTAAMLESFGVTVTEHPDGLTIEGDPDRPLRPGRVDARGDHRIAMCASLLALLAPAGTQITGAESIGSSFPSFHESLAHLGASSPTA